MLRFENFSGTPAADWAGRGIQISLAGAVRPSPGMHVLDVAELHRAQSVANLGLAPIPGVSYGLNNALRSHATQVVSGYYVETGGQIQIWAVMLNARSMHMTRQAHVTGPMNELPQLSAQLAQSLGLPAQRPPTNNATALRSFVDGIEAPDGVAAAAKFGQAAQLDSSFGTAYLAWAQSALGTRDGALFDRVVQMAKQHAGEFTAVDRAMLDDSIAEAHGNTAGRLEALTALTKADPANSIMLRSLADTEIALHKTPQAIAHYKEASNLAPEDGDVHNQIAYAYLSSGDEAKAVAEMKEYQRLGFEPANALDSLGDVQFAFNHYDEAGKSYVQAFQTAATNDQSTSLAKAAACELMQGNLKKADGIEDAFIKLRLARQDPFAPLFQADWLFETGRRAQAIQVAEKFSTLAIGPAFQSLAHTRLAAWQLQMGNRDEARRQAAMGMKQDVMSPLITLLAEPMNASDFSQRIEQLFPGPGNVSRRTEAQGYQLLFNREYRLAEPIWKQIADTSGDSVARALYAWVLVQNGKASEAAPLVRTTPPWRLSQSATLSDDWPAKFFGTRAATTTGAEAERNRKLEQLVRGS